MCHETTTLALWFMVMLVLILLVLRFTLLRLLVLLLLGVDVSAYRGCAALCAFDVLGHLQDQQSIRRSLLQRTPVNVRIQSGANKLCSCNGGDHNHKLKVLHHCITHSQTISCTCVLRTHLLTLVLSLVFFSHTHHTFTRIPLP